MGTVLGGHRINIANFSLGRRDVHLKPNEPLEAVAVVESEGLVPKTVLAQLRESPPSNWRAVSGGARVGRCRANASRLRVGRKSVWR